jgi:hypothetical protein
MKTIVVTFILLFPSGLFSQSVADAARENRPKGAKITSQRVFTDDDVRHGSQEAPSTDASKLSDSLEKAKRALEDAKGETEREYADSVVRDVQFPGRPDWEHRLYVQEQRVIATGQTLLDVASKSNASDALVRSAKSSFDLEVMKRDVLKVEGISKAADWERTTRK